MGKKLIQQPNRFTEAIYNFNPIQRELLGLIQQQIDHNKPIQRDFTINIKSFLEDKGLDVENHRLAYYENEFVKLRESGVVIKPLYGELSWASISLIEVVGHGEDDWELSIRLTETGAFLFYLKEPIKVSNDELPSGVTALLTGENESVYLTDQTLIKNYTSVDQQVLNSLSSAHEKKLYELLCQYKNSSFKTYKVPLVRFKQLLGLLEVVVEEKPNKLFQFEKSTKIVNEKYKGADGWNNLRKQINKWLVNIENNSRFTFTRSGKSLFATQGRPVRNLVFNFTHETIQPPADRIEVFTHLVEFYKLSRKQAIEVVNKFSDRVITEKIKNNLTRVRSDRHNPRSKMIYVTYINKRQETVDNVPGFIYAVLFKLGK